MLHCEQVRTKQGHLPVPLLTANVGAMRIEPEISCQSPQLGMSVLPAFKRYRCVPRWHGQPGVKQSEHKLWPRSQFLPSYQDLDGRLT